jgi:hypothetical protein
MKNSYLKLIPYFIIFIIIIILLYILYTFSNGTYYFEFFEQNTIPPPFFDGSFCTYNINKDTCDCRFQKDDLRYNFDSPETSCHNMCRTLNKETCLKTNGLSSIPYYCNIGGKCKKFNGTIISGQISANNCGTDPLNNQILLPFTDKQTCERLIDPCDQYNDPSKSVYVNKDICLKDNNCGFCTNDSGGGKCISGTISGPSDLQKYYYCQPTNRSSKNSYDYGNHVAYILQPPPQGHNYNSFEGKNQF